MNITYKRISIVLVLVAVGIFAGATAWVSIKNRIQKTPIQIQSITSTTASTSSTQTKTSITTNIKTYTNTEFGFEFQYPNDWELKENVFKSPFSKVNLMSWPAIEKLNSFSPPLLINVVTSDFVDSEFSNLNGKEVIVGGVSGKEYEYINEGLSEIDIILPLKENKIILGANKKYENYFNQIVKTFKFLK